MIVTRPSERAATSSRIESTWASVSVEAANVP
jgi:hypothetical protein